MTSESYPKDLRLQNQGTLRNDPDDSDLSDEEEFAPELEDSIQGPMTGFVERGPQDHQHVRVPPKSDKNKSSDKDKDKDKNPPPKDNKIKHGKTNQPPRNPNPDKYK